jgi:aminoglycoside phosphotransferase (APT) family kinase protein
MSDWILEYSPEVDKKIAKVIPKVLGVAVKNIERIKQGEVNYVYKVETEDKNILVRVSRYKDWPNIDKLNWISRQLARKDILQSRVLFSDTSSNYFKFGFMITEWINGEDGMSLIKEGKLSRKRAVEKIAETLQKIHEISVEGFGEFNGEGEGKFRSWEENLFSFVEDEKYKDFTKEKNQ